MNYSTNLKSPSAVSAFASEPEDHIYGAGQLVVFRAEIVSSSVVGTLESQFGTEENRAPNPVSPLVRAIPHLGGSCDRGAC
jgi:hypothetical protein